MKKCFLLLIALMLFLYCPLSALAEGETPQGETQQGGFEIDSVHVFSGMDKAYQDGYTPAVTGGKAVVVLPLFANTAIQGNRITATPNLGDTANSPFVFTNYQKSVPLTEETVAGGKVSCYLVRFDLTLSQNRKNGTYPIGITVQG